jgi:competence protein ComEA
VEVLLSPSTRQVYLTGAVGEAGTYVFQGGDRLGDADLSQVNPALRLQAQDHFHIPVLGEEARLPQGLLRPDGAPRLDLNKGTTEVLQTLPGIGEVRAAAGMAYRESQGPFETAEELMEVPGIGPAFLDGLREPIVVE